jgi:excisionase family DNA binding protein
LIEKVLYSTQEAAEALGVSTKSIARWIKDGRLKGVRAGRLWKIPAAEIQRMANEGTK